MVDFKSSLRVFWLVNSYLKGFHISVVSAPAPAPVTEEATGNGVTNQVNYSLSTQHYQILFVLPGTKLVFTLNRVLPKCLDASFIVFIYLILHGRNS